MAAPLLIRKIGAANRADLQGDVGKSAPGQRCRPGPFKSPVHRLLAAVRHDECRSAVGIPRQSQEKALLIIGLVRMFLFSFRNCCAVSLSLYA